MTIKKNPKLIEIQNLLLPMAMSVKIRLNCRRKYEVSDYSHWRFAYKRKHH